jgi:Predicted nucleic-acid-binding protein, contains PIN domain
MKNESLDTNLLLRLLTNDNPAQRKKVVKLLSCPNVTYHVADLAISETVYVLSTATACTRQEIASLIQQILNQPNINCNRALFFDAMQLYLFHPKLSFNDCCLAIYAKLNQAEPLWTFDKKLAIQAENAKLLA